MKDNIKKGIYFIALITWIGLLVYSIILNEDKLNLEMQEERQSENEHTQEIYLTEICKNLDFHANELGERMFGFYDDEGDFAWAKRSCGVELENSNISERGLLVKLQTTMDNIIAANPGINPKITIYINGTRIGEYLLYDNAYEYEISKEMIQKSSLNRYFVEIESNSCFIPSQMGFGEDGRELAIQVLYIGEKE